MSSKNTPKFECTKCDKKYTSLMGRCNGCGEFGTIAPVANAAAASTRKVGLKGSGASVVPAVSAKRAREVNVSDHTHRTTGIGELDRVLGGGFIPGGVILLAGEPGAGKSTLTTQVANHAGQQGMRVLLCSSEESIEQIKLRADRVGATSENFYMASTTDVGVVLGHIDEVVPDLVIVDSVQTMASSEVDSRSGSISQVVEVATILTRVAKERGIPLIIIGQVTKDGNIAGPRTMEHLVDVVIHFEGERDSTLRLLRGVKNRYGPADEIGCFEHTDKGMREVPDPSGLLLGRRETPSSGVATGIILEGRRCLPIEVQALTLGSHLPVPRRAVSGLDPQRAVMAMAITMRHTRVENKPTRLDDMDVYLATIGGITAREPSIDLAMSLAMTTSVRNVALPMNMVFIGELTLPGDVRTVPGVARRLREAQRLGFDAAMIPRTREEIKIPGMKIIQVSTIGEATNIAFKMSSAMNS